MILLKVFQPSAIKAGLESEYKDELFEELVDVLAQSYPPNSEFPRQEVIRALEQREAKMSTGIAKGIALPHATVEGIDSLRGAIGVSRKGIDYESLDGNPVYLVFMLVSPPQEAEIHLQTLRRLAVLMEDRDIVQRLSAAGSAEAAYMVLKEFEMGFSA
jgi:nitrogen PTS system EIIA component